MAILTTIYGGSADQRARAAALLPGLGQRLVPGGATCRIAEDPAAGAVTAVFAPGSLLEMRGVSARLGQVRAGGPDGWLPGEMPPEGSFVLFRHGAGSLEVVTDFAASRAVWYAVADGMLVASTSLRATVALLGGFDLDDGALGWFLSAGTLGPGLSWDRRVRMLGPNRVLAVRRNRGGVHCDERAAPAPDPDPPAGHSRARLERAIDEALAGMDFEGDGWALALSGGYDCRILLDGLRRAPGLVCVSWADPQIGERPGNDALIAHELAYRMNREHWMLQIRRPADSAEAQVAVERFVGCVDGRVDNIVGYIDGMQLWESLAERGIRQIIRGDEQFGSGLALRRSRIMQNMSLLSFADYQQDDTLRSLRARYRHDVPATLERRPGESVGRWRDRLRAEYETPVLFSALNHVRAHFMEVAAPLLSRRILQCMRGLSDQDRNEKALFKSIVAARVPAPPIATERAVLTRQEFLVLPAVAGLLADSIASERTLDLIPAAAREWLKNGLAKAGGEHDGARSVRVPAPRSLRALRQRFARPPRLQPGALALRVHLAKAAMTMFREDADWARAGNGGHPGRGAGAGTDDH